MAYIEVLGPEAARVVVGTAADGTYIEGLGPGAVMAVVEGGTPVDGMYIDAP